MVSYPRSPTWPPTRPLPLGTAPIPPGDRLTPSPAGPRQQVAASPAKQYDSAAAARTHFLIPVSVRRHQQPSWRHHTIAIYSHFEVFPE